MKMDIDTVATELKLDRSDWALTTFGEVAVQQKESVDRENTDINRYVKGEHMYSEDIHLREWGELKDEYLGPAFIRKFEEGDILYGSRRTYLKKVCIAPFEGITANTTFVIKANEDLIDRRLLPFLMLSEGFSEHSIRNSKGSVNPYVNWKDIAKYEFLLPPKKQQIQIVELLLAMDELIEKELCLLKKAKLQFLTQKEQWLLQGLGGGKHLSSTLKRDVADGWLDTTIGELINAGYIREIQDGNHGEIHPKASDYAEEGIPFIMANTLLEGDVNLEEAKKIPQAITDKLRIGFSKPGDVLLSHKGTVGEVAIVPDELDYPYLMLTPQVTYYRVNSEKLDNEFLYFVFTSNYFQEQLSSTSSQSTRAYVGITAQRSLKIAIPEDLELQKKIKIKLQEFNSNIRQINKAIFSSKFLLKSLVNQVF